MMKRFLALFKKVGGMDILKQYRRGHVFVFAMVQTLLMGFSKKGLELVRAGVNHKLLGKLRRKYKSEIAAFMAKAEPLPQARSRKVWVCWLQGMEQAPALVQRCHRSLQEHLSHREIILLTEENYRQYVTFPAHIQQKIDKGIITRTHMSDLLRLELLIHHGGTWIDATVFCSGDNIPDYMLESDLFLFQTLKPGLDGHATAISSWFMTSCTNHPILLLTRHLLYNYWKTHNAMVDYFLLHDFFQLSIEVYPELWNQVTPFSNATPHILLLRLFASFDPQAYDAICDQTPFHKLSYKFTRQEGELPHTYYTYLLNH